MDKENVIDQVNAIIKSMEIGLLSIKGSNLSIWNRDKIPQIEKLIADYKNTNINSAVAIRNYLMGLNAHLEGEVLGSHICDAQFAVNGMSSNLSDLMGKLDRLLKNV